MNKKIRLMMFTIGIGFSCSAFAIPCEVLAEECEAGSSWACERFEAGICSC